MSEAAFCEQVLEGEDVDLGLLPIQRCWPDDVGKLITFGLVVTRGTRQKRQNVAIYRQQVIARNRVIMRWLPHRGGALDFADWRARIRTSHSRCWWRSVPIRPPCWRRWRRCRTPCPNTNSPDCCAVSAPASGTARIPAWMRRPGAEIVLEGFIHPGDTALEGPFGDHTGYYNAQGEFPVLTIERMRLRRDAIYHGSYMGRAPHDEPSVLAIGAQRGVRADPAQGVPGDRRFLPAA